MVTIINDEGIFFNEDLFRFSTGSRERLIQFIAEIRKPSQAAKHGYATVDIDVTNKYAYLYYTYLRNYNNNPQRFANKIAPASGRGKWVSGGNPVVAQRSAVERKIQPIQKPTHAPAIDTRAQTSAIEKPTSAIEKPTYAIEKPTSAIEKPTYAVENRLKPPPLPEIPQSAFSQPSARPSLLSYLDGINIGATNSGSKVNIGDIFNDTPDQQLIRSEYEPIISAMPYHERAILGTHMNANSMQYAATMSNIKSYLISEIKELCEMMNMDTPKDLDKLSYPQLEGYHNKLERNMRKYSMKQNLNNAIVTLGGGLERVFDGKNDIPGIGRSFRFKNLSKNLERMESNVTWNCALNEIAKNHTVDVSPWFTVGISLATAILSSAESVDADEEPKKKFDMHATM